MSRKGMLLLLICVAMAVVPAGAQTDVTRESSRKVHQLSPALQKRVAERMATLRANAAAPVGPLFDRLTKSWTIETADCSLVKSQVKGTGFKKHTAWVSMNDDATFHLEIRTEGSGTAVDASGNKYIWIYNAVADIDTADPEADPIVGTGFGPDTFQLIPLSSGGSGYTAVGFTNADSPTSLNSITPIATSTPAGCEPL